MSRPRDPSIPSKSDFCSVENEITEWREHKIGRHGTRKWRCVSCHNKRERKVK